MKSPFTVDHARLAALNAVETTELFRELLWCEVRRLQISSHRVEISLKTTVADGGIDANICVDPASDSFLRKGTTSFQIKAGDSFKPWLKSHIHKELFSKASNEQSLKNLAPGIQACLKNGGTYFVVTTGHDLTPAQLQAGEKLLRDALKCCGHKNAKVGILGQTQLAALISLFPAMLYRVQGLTDRFFLDYENWKQQDLMQPALKLGQQQVAFIESIRSGLRDGKVQHIRVIGEPGIGKTRLVLEALSCAEFSPLVIYAPLGDDFQRSQLLLDFVRAGNELQAIVVVDDCPEKERASIWSSLKGKSGVRLITLDHGPERSRDAAMSVLHCPQLTQKEIEEILQSYVGQSRSLNRWAEMCAGSPRVAHAVGENLRLNPDDVLKPPATVPIWDRFISGYQPLNSPEARQLLIVMRYLALFEKFGFDAPVENEGHYIAGLVQAADPTITWAVFQDVVQKLRDRRILQGKRTLVIVPRLLHIHLWLEFWNSHGRSFDFVATFAAMPESLQNWFLRLFSYAHANPVSLAVVSKLLDRDGPFDDHRFLASEHGARFLGYLTEADPGSAGRLLLRTVAKWPSQQLKDWSRGRQSIVWALERIAVWREHFPTAVAVLIPMALNENATNSNNSTGILRDLFVIGEGWAATQATPQERFHVLKQLLESAEQDRRTLALSLCKAWCATFGHTRTVGAEHQGLRDELPFWRPKTYGEIFDAWRLMWPELFKITRGWGDIDRIEANNTIIEAGSSLLMTVLARDVVDTWTSLEGDSATNRERLTHAVINALSFRTKHMPKGIAGRLKKLDRRITGKSFWQRFQRYVLFTCWEEGHPNGSEHENDAPLAKRVEKLAQELAASPSLLTKHLQQLVDVDGRRLYEFGQKYGTLASNPTLTRRLIQAQRQGHPASQMRFLSGYMSAVKAADIFQWDQELLKVLDDPNTRRMAESIVRGCGFSPSVLEASLMLIPKAEIPASFFQPLIWDADHQNVDTDLVSRVLSSLAQQNSVEASGMAIELADRFYCQKDKMRAFGDELVIEQLLLSPTVLPETKTTMYGYHWKRVADEYCRRFPERELKIFRAFLDYIDDVEVGDHKDIGQVAVDIAKRQPNEVWPLLAKALEGDAASIYGLTSWLGGGPRFSHRPGVSAITFFEPETVISWALEDRDRRRCVIERFLPKTLALEHGGKLTRLHIEKMMVDEDDDFSLISHFQMGGWVGSRSGQLRGLRDAARSWLSDDNSPKVSRWLSKYLSVLDEQIERAEIEEERRGY